MKVQKYKYSIKAILSTREDYRELEKDILEAIDISASHWRKLKNLRIDSNREMKASDLVIVARMLGVTVEKLMNEPVNMVS